ncbi:MAG TPA: ATP-binding protein [Spirochaetota bacterium]|nr:ATP-binding protein [Spirochaetota bacterium]
MKIYPKTLIITILIVILPSLFFIFYFTRDIEKNGDKFIEERLYKRYLNIKLFLDSIKDNLELKAVNAINDDRIESIEKYFDFFKIENFPGNLDESEKESLNHFTTINNIVVSGRGVEVTIKIPYIYEGKKIIKYIEAIKYISEDEILKNYYVEVNERSAIFNVVRSKNNKIEFNPVKSEFTDAFNNRIFSGIADKNIMREIVGEKSYALEKNKKIGNKIYDLIYFTIRNYNQTVGIYVVGIQKSNIIEMVSTMKRNVLFLILIATLLSVLSTFLISRMLIFPIRKIENFSTRAALGDFSYQLKINQKDEVGSLANNINEMVNKLNYTKILEEKVKERTEELEKAKKEAEKNSVYKTKLLDNMSHELRTPLNTINGISNLLYCGGFDKKQEIIEKINSVCDKVSITDDFTKKLSKIKEKVNSGSDFDVCFLKNLLDQLNETPINDGIIEDFKEIEELCIEEKMEKQRAYEYIKDAGDYLSSLIDMIMNISRIDAGKIEINKEEINFTELIDKIKIEAKTFLEEKNKEERLSVIFDVDDKIEEIFLDRNKYKQIILSLINNAVKFTVEGRVVIKIEMKNDKIITNVKDSGIGIKDEDKSKIFSEFGKIVEEDENSGTGLGLVFTKKLVDLLGGR